MPNSICLPCIGIGCDNPADLAAGIDSAIYSSQDFSFIVDCPTGCFCPPGLFPSTITILASTILPVIPPILEPGAPIILRLQGCTSLITRTLSTGSSQVDIVAAAQSMQAEWAGQQSLCLAALVPGVDCNMGTSISVCNDAQTGWCGDVVPAGTFCQTLNTTGLTASQITAATATLKTNLNKLGSQRNCSGLLCPFTYQRIVGNPAQSVFTVLIQNVGPNTIDLSGLSLCYDNGGGQICSPTTFPTIPPFSGPTQELLVTSPLPLTVDCFNLGSKFLHDIIPLGFRDTITMVYGC